MQSGSLPYNPVMSHLDILLPFGLPPEELANDLFRELNVPALATLIARAQARHERRDAFARAMPHEAWLAQRFGLDASGADNSPPLAAPLLRQSGLAAETGTWFIVNPVHFHIARDHLVLTDPRQLRLAEAEARALFEMAQPLFYEFDKTLLYGNANTWFVRADDWAQLLTSTPDAASGHNIDIWMPKGEGERNWRKLQNEVQMHWFTHPVNAEREACGLKPVNSLWLWGGATLPQASAAPQYTHVFNPAGWLGPLAALAPHHAQASGAADILAARPESGLLLLDGLGEPALANDWAEWLARLHAWEETWFAPLLAALKSGGIGRLSLTLTHQTGIASFSANRQALRKFWVKPSLSPLRS